MADGREDGVANLILNQIPKLLVGAEFRIIGRQINNAHPLRKAPVAIAKMEPSLITDYHVNDAFIAGGQILQIDLIPLQAHRRDLAKVGLAVEHIERTKGSGLAY